MNSWNGPLLSQLSFSFTHNCSSALGSALYLILLSYIHVLSIALTLQALEAIEDALKAGASGSKLAELTSRFYTIIPHDFGRRVPPVIRDHETLQKKFDMLLVGWL